MTNHSQSGFIALISAIILASVLTMLVIGASGAAMVARMDALGYENRATARALAESCAQTALLRIATSAGGTVATGTVTVDAAGDSCVIVSIVRDAARVVITARAASFHSFSVLQTIATTTPSLQIESQTELEP